MPTRFVNHAVLISRLSTVVPCIFILLMTIVSLPISARAATIEVTNTNPSGTGSLRWAIETANSGDYIDAIGVSGVIYPTSVLTIDKNVFIDGPGWDNLAVDGSRAHRVFEVLPNVHLSLAGLNIQNGYAVSGGGLYLNPGSSAYLRSVRFENNMATEIGGAIRADLCSLTLEYCLINGNRISEGCQSCLGGGIYAKNLELLYISSTTVSNNHTPGGVGGGLAASGGTDANLVNCTISGNASSEGGGLFIQNGTLKAVNTTITNNAASSQGGGVVLKNGQLNLLGVIIEGDRASSGSEWSCSGDSNVFSDGYNLIGSDEGCEFDPQTSDLVGQPARLDALADYGGPTPTHALLPNSPAIDSAVSAPDVYDDQRLVSRPQDGLANGTRLPDRGSFELRAHGLTVRVQGDGEGKVVSHPSGIDCGDQCHNGFRINTKASLTAEPEPGSIFNGFSDSCTGTEPCTLFMDQKRFVTAEFSRIRYTIDSQADAGGTIDPSGTFQVIGGEDLVFTIDPEDEYIIEEVTVDGESVGQVSRHEIKNISGDHVIRAYFTPSGLPHWILAQAGSGGWIAPVGEVSVKDGQDANFLVQADENHRIADVRVDGDSVGAVSRYNFVQVTQNHTIHALFVPSPLEITASSNAGGQIIPSGVVEVEYGEPASFVIQPDHGYHIEDLLVDGQQEGLVSYYSFRSVIEDHAIEAVFASNEQMEHYIYAQAVPPEGGHIYPSGPVIVQEGSDQTFTITAKPGYRNTALIVDQETKPEAQTYTFDQISTNHQIRAVFTQSHLITATAETGGTIEPEGQVEVLEGNDQNFLIDPDEGFHIEKVEVDGESQGPIFYYNFKNVQQSHTIRAGFEPSPPGTYYIYAQAEPIDGGQVGSGLRTPAPSGSSQTIGIIPHEGFFLAEVIVDGVSKGADLTSVNFENISSDHMVLAVFEPNRVTINATTSGQGTITPSGAVEAAYLSDMTFTISPVSGAEIHDVIVDGVSQGAVERYTFYNVIADHTIEAVFSPGSGGGSGGGGGGGCFIQETAVGW